MTRANHDRTEGAVRFLRVTDYERHQHYRNRRPPWIKLHAAMVDDYRFARLPDASKAHLMLLWVLASKYDNRIPYDLGWIKGQLGATSSVDVEALISLGFLELLDDASETPASCTHAILPETEEKGAGEKEHKGEPEASAAGAAATVSRSSWITRFAEAWRAQYGGEMGIEPALRALGRLVKHHGQPEVLRRWRIYLAATDGAYASAARFASTWGVWSQPSSGPARARRENAGEANYRAARAALGLEEDSI
jgi:hypothetical protein